MGTVFPPTYANLSMGYNEIERYDLVELKYNHNLDINLNTLIRLDFLRVVF